MISISIPGIVLIIVLISALTIVGLTSRHHRHDHDHNHDQGHDDNGSNHDNDHNPKSIT
jgi:ABC-type nickel/cobalt efflux system permease component RcnA